MIMLFWMMLLAFLLPRAIWYQRIQNNKLPAATIVNILTLQLELSAIFSLAVGLIGNGFVWIFIILLPLFISAIFLWMVCKAKDKTAPLIHVLTWMVFSLYLYFMLATVSSTISEHALLKSLSAINACCKIGYLLKAATLVNGVIVLCGLLIATNEINILIKWILIASDIKDPITNACDVSYPNAGLLIGFLERTVVYLSIMFGYTNAIGVVLVLKSVTRFKELDTRKYAEYMLIGTLISFILSSIIALFIKQYLKNLT